MKNVLAVLIGAFITAGCAGTSPQMQVIHDAAEALGGQAPIERIRTLVIEGEGIAPNLGQNLTPETTCRFGKSRNSPAQSILRNRVCA